MERYRTYSSYLKELYGEKVYKLPLNIPVTCPNRIDSYGCSFCGGAGTGFEAMDAQVPVREQLRKTKEKISAKYFCINQAGLHQEGLSGCAGRNGPDL